MGRFALPRSSGAAHLLHLLHHLIIALRLLGKLGQIDALLAGASHLDGLPAGYAKNAADQNTVRSTVLKLRPPPRTLYIHRCQQEWLESQGLKGLLESQAKQPITEIATR